MQVLVRNVNSHPYREQFRDRLIEIPAGKAIEMEHSEALLFLGSFNQPVLDHDGRPTPEGFKRLNIEPLTGKAEAPILQAEIDPLVCTVCKYKAENAADLAEHMKLHAESAAPVDEEAEAYAKAKRKAKLS